MNYKIIRKRDGHLFRCEEAKEKEEELAVSEWMESLLKDKCIEDRIDIISKALAVLMDAVVESRILIDLINALEPGVKWIRKSN